jgi:hypothetical protein
VCVCVCVCMYVCFYGTRVRFCVCAYAFVYGTGVRVCAKFSFLRDMMHVCAFAAVYMPPLDCKAYLYASGQDLMQNHV